MATTQTTTTASAASTDATPTTLSKIQAHPPIVNLGKVKPKRAKKLRRGNAGALTDKLNMRVQQIKSGAGLEGNYTPLFISYEEKPNNKPKKKKKIEFMGLKIDRKKFKDSMKDNGISANFL